MKLGKLILGSVTLLITVYSALSFKIVKTFNLNQLYTLSSGGFCNPKECWTRAIGNPHSGCLSKILTLRTSQDGGVHCATIWNGARTTTM